MIILNSGLKRPKYKNYRQVRNTLGGWIMNKLSLGWFDKSFSEKERKQFKSIGKIRKF